LATVALCKIHDHKAKNEQKKKLIYVNYFPLLRSKLTKEHNIFKHERYTQSEVNVQNTFPRT
jgi:hypothetical protein